MSIEHTTRAITENKYLMQLFADKKSLEADIAALKNLKWSNLSDPRTSDYAIKQKEYELSQIENRTKGKDYSSVKNQCEKYFTDNTSLFDKNQIITETRSMLAKGQIVNEWPHLAAVFLLDHAVVTDAAKAWLAAVTKPIVVHPIETSLLTPAPIQVPQLTTTDWLWSEETIVPPTRPTVSIPQKSRSPLNKPKTPEEDLPEMFQKKQTMVFKDGAYYLTWPKGNTKRIDIEELIVNLNLPKNAPENLQKSVSLVQDFAFILDAYLLKNPEKKTQYDFTLKWIQADFANPDIQTGKSVVDIKKWTYTLFSNNNLLKDSDLYTINQAMDIKEPKARRFAILSFIRDRLGQSDLVGQKLMEDTMSRFWFSTDDVIVKNGDLSSTKLDAKQITKVREAIDKARSEANSNWMKNKDAYLKLFQAQNPGTTVDIEAARVANEKLTIVMSAKREIVYQNLYNKKDLSPELALLQNILGAGSTKMSDKSWEISKEVAGMIGMEAVAIGAGMLTMGAGTVAINALAFWVNATRGVRALEAYNAASKTKQTLTTSARILGGGAAFEAGGATTRSLIENGDLISMHSKEWYVQSIAMMGVMRWLGHIFEKTGILALQNGVGIAKNIIPFAGQVAIEWTAIFGTSATIGSVFFDRRDNWTLEQMAQAMLMATIFKWAGRVFAGKDKTGNIEIRQEPSAPPTTTTWVPNNRSLSTDTQNHTWSFQSIKEYFASSKDWINGFNPIVFTTKSWKYEYTFWQDQNWFHSLRKLKTEIEWQNIDDTVIPKAVKDQMRQRAGDPSVDVPQNNIAPQPTNIPNQTPTQSSTPPQQAILTTGTYKDIRNAVVDTLKNEETISIGGITIKKWSKKWQYEWTGKDKNTIDINKTGTKDELLQSIKEDLPTDKVILDARNIRPGTVKETYFNLGQNRYLIDEAGNFRKSTNSWAQNLSETEVTALINAHPESVASAIMDSHVFKSFFAKAWYLNKEGKYLKNIWGIASTEIAPTGFWKTIGGYPLNLVRLPFIQTQRLINVWGSGNHAAIPAKVWDSIKVLGTASSTPFASKTQWLATLLTMGTVAWGVKNQIETYNADNKNTDKVDTLGEYAVGVFWRYLASLNITVPYDVAKWIYESTLGDWK